MRQLDVYLGESLIGRIVENRKGGRFEYEQSIIGKLAGRPVLSMAFPAKVRPFGEAKTSAWFNGLLPEGNRRDEVCRSLGVLPYDWIGLLAEIGWECAGAVRVFEHGRERACELRLEKISPSELAEKLSSATERLPQVESGLFRMSLGGFQEKMCVVMPAIPEGVSSVAADDVLLPMGDSPSTHILKPESEHYPGLAESEAWAMTAVGNAARASRVALLDLDDAPSTLVVERYDRIADNGFIRRMFARRLESTRTVSTLLRVRLRAMTPHTLQLPVCCRSSLPIPRARRRSCCASLLRTWRLATGMRMPRTRRFSTASKWSPRSHRSTMWRPLPRSSRARRFFPCA